MRVINYVLDLQELQFIMKGLAPLMQPQSFFKRLWFKGIHKYISIWLTELACNVGDEGVRIIMNEIPNNSSLEDGFYLDSMYD